MSVANGINAIAHAAEGLYAQDANPVMSLMPKKASLRWPPACPAWWPIRTT